MTGGKTSGTTLSTSIYGLCDPASGQLRYVGKTVKVLKDRLSGHLSEARRPGDNYRLRWVRSLLREGRAPEIFLIERAGGNGDEEEKFHIAYFKSLGCELTNGTVGGDGRQAGSTLSEGD